MKRTKIKIYIIKRDRDWSIFLQIAVNKCSQLKLPMAGSALEPTTSISNKSFSSGPKVGFDLFGSVRLVAAAPAELLMVVIRDTSK